MCPLFLCLFSTTFLSFFPFYIIGADPRRNISPRFLGQLTSPVVCQWEALSEGGSIMGISHSLCLPMAHFWHQLLLLCGFSSYRNWIQLSPGGLPGFWASPPFVPLAKALQQLLRLLISELPHYLLLGFSPITYVITSNIKFPLS